MNYKNLGVYRKEHVKAMEDVPDYLSNPINAFTLIKRLTTDLNVIEKNIKDATEYVKNVTIYHTDVKYPTEEDLKGAAQALTRLQNTYQLDIAKLAEGRFSGESSGMKNQEITFTMTTSDCYELGLTLYNEKDIQNAVRWMMEALRKYDEENNIYNFTKANILEYISYCHYLLDDNQAALDWTNKLLELDPKNERALMNVQYYRKHIAEKKLNKNGAEEINKVKEEETYIGYDRRMYESLCRGEIDIPGVISKRLRCSYLTKNHPFLLLAPIKVEQIYIEPDVFLYHQVISDEEIEQIKSMAKPRFKRATVREVNGESSFSDYRISKSAWLLDEESPAVARVTQRTADFTGLSMDTAEELQVVNYGIGGHYDPHYDFTRHYELPYIHGNGNRIATVLFYMSDVAQGGATVFIELGLTVFPVKNAALVWMNLHPSGEGDISTRHAACPVLRGSKWVSNKWIHQVGQELIKPCNLEYQQENVLRSIIKGVPRTLT
ncbi:prolyl 4-hydroxylase subunit alpha-2-like [Battus philenor]|uniref:prolyl 4-hydroxylase subunit alpha-2-like n=1 Tax=Battus philenor TaxID=42288 RepID=UPI0035CF97FE